jgi:Trypsin-like peptidase domain/Tetratricopeptide Repeats-Sensor
MSWDEKAFGTKFRTLIEKYDRDGVGQQCEELIRHLFLRPDEYPEEDARPILQNLRKNRYFDLMQRVADAFLQGGDKSPIVRRLYAQALIDQSILAAALHVLRPLALETVNNNQDEYAEAYGLIGRAYKQRYMDAYRYEVRSFELSRNQQNLAEAINAYSTVYNLDKEKFIWQGVNMVALLCRAEKDGVRLNGHRRPKQDAEYIAQEILDQVNELNNNDKAGAWDFATAAEAFLALEKFDDALLWLEKYVADSKVDAFQCASTLRQFEEVWRLNVKEEPGSHLLPMLNNALLIREGGRVEFSPQNVSAHFTGSGEFKTDKTYEKVFGTDSFMGLEAYRLGLERCRAIALIRMLGESRGFGTGFLIRGAELHPSYGDELLLMTNAHVISDDPNSIRPGEVEASFEALDGVKCGVEKVLWSSPPTQCDATLLRLNMSDETATLLKQVAPYPVVKEPPVRNDKDRVCIIGHPGGAGLSLSLQDNLLLDYDAQKMHYRTPTENGSSGSPVFNKQWKLVGLHHKGDSHMPKLHGTGAYEANEGIRISAIIEALAAKAEG